MSITKKIKSLFSPTADILSEVSIASTSIKVDAEKSSIENPEKPIEQPIEQPIIIPSTFTLSIDHLVKIILLDASAKFKEIMPEIEIKVIVQTAVANNQDIADVYSAIANLFVNAGQAELALEYFLKSLSLKPNLATHSLYLQSLIMSEATNEKILQECLSYVDQYYKKETSSENGPSSFSNKIKNKKLKIGYACHFLHNSVAKSIVLPFIKAHDRNRVEVHVYYDWNQSDERPDMTSIADQWHNTKDLNDDEFFNLVREHDIDVFVEMNGHTAINRYAVCMKRVAPVQISFYN